MKITPLAIAEILLIEPRVFSDARGFFMENFNEKKFQEATGLKINFVQDNCSRSSYGVLRGMHYQREPHAQGKLVQVINGCIFDVVADIREDSSTFGQWLSVELSDSNHHQLWVPPGFAHGFVVLSDFADVVYKTTDYYAPEFESCIRWDDPTLAIDWPISADAINLSTKDSEGLLFKSNRSRHQRTVVFR